MDDMPGMSMATGAPTASPPAAADTFVPAADAVPAGTPKTLAFHVVGPNGHPVTRYQPYQSKLLSCYVIRSDLTGFQYLDAAMQQDGTWNVALPALPAGSYRAFVTFAAPDASQGTPLVHVLSRPFTVPGAAGGTPLPPPASIATVDGYTVTLAATPVPGRPVPLTITVTQGGRPVESLNRYLDGYAHLTAFHTGDTAFAQIQSAGGIGPNGALTTEAIFPEGGDWRLFAQFNLAGTVHTAAFTLTVPASG
jgi:hypothetical protein